VMETSDEAPRRPAARAPYVRPVDDEPLTDIEQALERGLATPNGRIAALEQSNKDLQARLLESKRSSRAGLRC